LRFYFYKWVAPLGQISLTAVVNDVGAGWDFKLEMANTAPWALAKNSDLAIVLFTCIKLTPNKNPKIL